MKVKDRIKGGIRRVRAGDLTPHPKNWRTHPDAQKDAMRGVLAEIGIADVLIVRELEDKTLQILDGHLRAETTPDQKVPCVVVDLNDEEALKLLATHDAITGLAETDSQVLLDLVAEIETESDGVGDMHDKLVADLKPTVKEDETVEAEEGVTLPEPGDADCEEIDVPWGVVISCDNEQHQVELLEELSKRGLTCRALV